MHNAVVNPVIEYVSFGDLKFPKTVYKYRTVKDENHLSVLTDQVVFFAAPRTFDDDFDCRIPERFDLLTDDDILDQYYKIFQKQQPNWDPILLRNEAIKWTNMGLLTDKARLQYIENTFWEEFNEKFGVLSLTENNSSLFMWTLYSDDFNGFCVGFDSRVLFRLAGGGGIVNYVKEFPLINPFDSPETKRTLLTFFKLNKWIHEEEYRLQIMWKENVSIAERRIKVPAVAFKEIILGDNLIESVRDEIISKAKIVNPNISVFLAKRKLDTVSISLLKT